jgi:hypothetical protein
MGADGDALRCGCRKSRSLRYSKQGVPQNRLFFLERNVTMSALTDATVIVEAAETSGTLLRPVPHYTKGENCSFLTHALNGRTFRGLPILSAAVRSACARPKIFGKPLVDGPFQKIDEQSRPDHSRLSADDECYFLSEYTSGKKLFV